MQPPKTTVTVATILAFISMLILWPTASNAASQPLTIYVLAGQSNMVGRSDTPPDSRVVYWHDGWQPAIEPIPTETGGLGPGLPFAAALLHAGTNRRIGLVQCAVGGTGISQWQPHSDSLYDACRAQTQAALASGGTLAGVLWMQGETDAANPDAMPPERSPVGPEWGERFTALVAAWRDDFANPALPVVYGRIGLAPTVAKWHDFTYRWRDVRQAQDSVRLPFVHEVTTDDLVRYDGLHYDEPSVTVLGQRMAAAYLRPVTYQVCLAVLP